MVVISFANERCGSSYSQEEWSDAVIGTVKRVVPERGFGFITGEDGQEYFFHRTALSSSLSFETLTPNQRVSFEVESSDKGPRASRVRSA